jgi:hypothetical protein
MGAVAMEGQALMGLGNALALQGEPDRARQCLRDSIDILEKVNATHHLQQAKGLMATL